MELLEGNTVSSYIKKGRGEVRAITIIRMHERLLSSKIVQIQNVSDLGT